MLLEMLHTCKYCKNYDNGYCTKLTNLVADNVTQELEAFPTIKLVDTFEIRGYVKEVDEYASMLFGIDSIPNKSKRAEFLENLTANFNELANNLIESAISTLKGELHIGTDLSSDVTKVPVEPDFYCKNWE